MHSLTLALHGSEWSASGPGRFNLGVTHWIGGCVGLGAGLDMVMKKICM